MLELVTGIALSFITQLSKDKKIDGKWIILGLSIIAGGIYYTLNYFYPGFTENAWKTILEIYGFSQIIYNYIIKVREKKKE